MYLQIMEQIKQRIAVSDWPRDHEIPSIRQLAMQLRVSVITVKRAYLELEREGIIVTQHGKGSRVANAPNLEPRLYEEEFQHHLGETVRLAQLLNLETETLLKRVRDAARTTEKERV
jgi:GntR family transcriptional regulator